MLKFFIILFIILYQSIAHSKTSNTNFFNQKYLSSYFSALISFNNQNSEKSIKYFNLSKNLKKTHNKFLENYVFSLVENEEINKAIKEIRYSKNSDSQNFYQAKILLIIDEIKNENFLQAKIYLEELKNLSNDNRFELIITEIIKSYVHLFDTNQVIKDFNDLGKIGLITSAFQYCYLNSSNSLKYFEELINSEDGDYSRYLYFYFYNLIKNKEIDKVVMATNSIDFLNSNLLVLQSKNWVVEKKFEKF